MIRQQHVLHIGFVRPTQEYRPARTEADEVLGVTDADASVPAAPGTASLVRRPRTQSDPLTSAATDDDARLVPARPLRTVIMSQTLGGGGCKRMYDTKRHALARQLLAEARLDGAPELPRDANMQDVLDAAAGDPSDVAVLTAYAALLRQSAELYPCTQVDCGLSQMRLLHDLLFLQGVCHKRCDPRRDEEDRHDARICSETMRKCLSGINTMLAALQPATCQQRSSSILVAGHSSKLTPALLDAVQRIRAAVPPSDDASSEDAMSV